MKYRSNNKLYESELNFNRMYIKKKNNIYINKTSKHRYIIIHLIPKTDIEVKLKSKIICWLDYSKRKYLSEKTTILYKGIKEKIIIQVKLNNEIDIDNIFDIREFNKLRKLEIQFEKKTNILFEKIKKEIKFNNKNFHAILQIDSCLDNKSQIKDHLKLSSEKKKVLYIGDESTLLSLKDIYDVYNVSKEEVSLFIRLIDGFSSGIYIPEILFIESFWNGKNNSWSFRNKYTNEFFIGLLVDKLKQFDCKVIFYNKEDPYHYKDFLWIAGYSDLIITSDKNMITEYKQKFPQKKVLYNSFFINEKIFNPYSNTSTEEKIYFAGNYYNNRFPERKYFLDQLFNNLEKKNIELEIIDRSYNVKNTTFGFPMEYQKFIKTGALSVSQLNDYIKNYKYGINVNSIFDTDTFVSRRLLEHVALGKIMVTNYSKAVENLNNNSIIYSQKNDIIDLFEKLKNEKTSDEEILNNSLKILIEYGSLIFKIRLNIQLFNEEFVFVINEENFNYIKKQIVPFEYKVEIIDEEIVKCQLYENRFYIPRINVGSSSDELIGKNTLMKLLIEEYIKGDLK